MFCRVKIVVTYFVALFTVATWILLLIKTEFAAQGAAQQGSAPIPPFRSPNLNYVKAMRTYIIVICKFKGENSIVP